MKSITKSLLLILSILLSFSSFSQLTEDDIVLNFNYGIYGFVKGEAFRNFENSHNFNDQNYQVQYNSNYIGPAALIFQYMATDNFGIGLETNFTSRDISWRETYIDNSQQQVSNNYNVNQIVYRIMIRTSWEFVNEEKIQVNWANSLGHRRAIWSGDYDNFYYWLNVNNNGGWPIAFRTALGLRYWIHKNIAINTEFGFSGGSVMNFGVSGKF